MFLGTQCSSVIVPDALLSDWFGSVFTNEHPLLALEKALKGKGQLKLQNQGTDCNKVQGNSM